MANGYTPSPSACLTQPGFTMIDKYPIRSPLAVADFLAPRVAGKRFCEIGTRNGDIMACLKPHALEVTAIELDQVYCRKLRARGFSVLCQPFETVDKRVLAKCDLYFWWPMDAQAQNEVWLRRLLTAHASFGANATVYVAHDTHFKNDMVFLPKLAKHYKAKSIDRIFFDEGGGRDALNLVGEASYSTPFFDRPGRWGVFHMARFELGAGIRPGRKIGQFTRRIRPNWVRAEPSPHRPGFCEMTRDELGMGDCEHGDKGVMHIDDPANGHANTLAGCVDWCLHFCSRCNYVSFSREVSDRSAARALSLCLSDCARPCMAC